MPKQPLHHSCHCTLKSLTKEDVRSFAKAICPIEKFTEYVFHSDEKSKGKKQLFESWGYSINDSNLLKLEFERQALNKYLSGQYELHDLDWNGQRLSIKIELNGRSFKTGWILEPDGTIRNTTPFGGWSHETNERY